MSALTDHIWREHRMVIPFRCSCDCVASTHEGFVAHIAAVTEAAVREQVARDIEAARSQAVAWVAESHLFAWQAALANAARIARGEQ